MTNNRNVASLMLALGGCCFGGSTGNIDIDLPPPDPSMDALWACMDETVVSQRCPAPMTVLPASELRVGLTYRTRNLSRFAASGALVALVGDPPQELRRAATTNTSEFPPPVPGESYTWSEHIGLECPDTGWPVGVPVHFELRDVAGAVAASTTVTFTGPAVVPPPPRVEDVVSFCGDETLFAGEGSHFCPTNAASLPHGVGHLHASFTSGNPALWAQGSTMVLERLDRHGAWISESELPLAPVVLPADETETMHTTYDLTDENFRAHSRWRARFVVAGATIAEREIDIE